MNNSKMVISIGMAFLLVFALISVTMHNSLEIERHRTEFEAIMAAVDKDVPGIMYPQLLDSPLIRDVEIDINSSVTPVKNHDFYYWTEQCTVTFYLSDEFDTFHDKRQYQFIDEYGNRVYNLKSKTIRDLLPNHRAYAGYLTEENDYLERIYGKRVFEKTEYDILFKTSRNIYQYSRDIDNYFVKNGKDHWVRSEAEKKREPAPYVGMFESLISFTDLGKPTVVEKCIDFYLLKPSHRYKKYTWYNNDIQDLEHLKAIATVRYWNYAKDVQVSGYVSDIILYD